MPTRIHPRLSCRDFEVLKRFLKEGHELPDEVQKDVDDHEADCLYHAGQEFKKGEWIYNPPTDLELEARGIIFDREDA